MSSPKFFQKFSKPEIRWCICNEFFFSRISFMPKIFPELRAKKQGGYLSCYPLILRLRFINLMQLKFRPNTLNTRRFCDLSKNALVMCFCFLAWMVPPLWFVLGVSLCFAFSLLIIVTKQFL